MKVVPTWKKFEKRWSKGRHTEMQMILVSTCLMLTGVVTSYVRQKLLLPSALQPLWVMAWSTIVEYSQQEGFYRVPLPAARQNPQLGGPVIRTFQLPTRGVPHVWNDASEPQQRKVELWARNFREFCRKWRLPRHFWVLLNAVNLRHGTDGFISPPKESALRNFSSEKSDGFGRV